MLGCVVVIEVFWKFGKIWVVLDSEINGSDCVEIMDVFEVSIGVVVVIVLVVLFIVVVVNDWFKVFSSKVFVFIMFCEVVCLFDFCCWLCNFWSVFMNFCVYNFCCFVIDDVFLSIWVGVGVVKIFL